MDDAQVRQTIVDAIGASVKAEREPMMKLLQCFASGNFDVGAFDAAVFDVAKQRQETDTMIDQLLDAVEAARNSVGNHNQQRKLEL